MFPASQKVLLDNTGKSILRRNNCVKIFGNTRLNKVRYVSLLQYILEP
jgi:hypothetical protein